MSPDSVEVREDRGDGEKVKPAISSIRSLGTGTLNFETGDEKQDNDGVEEIANDVDAEDDQVEEVEDEGALVNNIVDIVSIGRGMVSPWVNYGSEQSSAMTTPDHTPCGKSSSLARGRIVDMEDVPMLPNLL